MTQLQSQLFNTSGALTVLDIQMRNNQELSLSDPTCAPSPPTPPRYTTAASAAAAPGTASRGLSGHSASASQLMPGDVMQTSFSGSDLITTDIEELKEVRRRTTTLLPAIDLEHKIKLE